MLLSQCSGAAELVVSLDLLDFPPAHIFHGFRADPLCSVTSLTSLTSLRRGPSPHSAALCGISQLVASNRRLVNLYVNCSLYSSVNCTMVAVVFCAAMLWVCAEAAAQISRPRQEGRV